MEKRLNIYAFLYLSATVLVLFFPLLNQHTLFFRDTQLLFVPMKHFLEECLHQHELPLWNPRLFCGTPFMSDIQAGLFYPLSVVFYFVPVPQALNIFVVVHYILAAYFVYALTRHWNCSMPAASLAALCFTLGGYLVSTANVLNNLQSAIWLPMIFLSLEKGRRCHAIFYRLLGAIFLAIQFLGGEPQLLLFTLVLVFAHNLIVNRETSWLQHTARTGIVLAFVGIISMALVTVQLLPTWEMVRDSVRPEGFNFQEATKFSLNPLALFQLLGPPSFDIYHHSNKQFSWLLSNYFGLIPLIFALTAIVSVRDRRIRFWTGCLFVSLALALGKHTPFFFLVYKTIPFFKSFRFPEKFMFICAYSIAFLAAFGFDWVLQRDFRHGKRIIAIIALLAISIVAATIIRTSSGQSVANYISLPSRSFLLVSVSLLCVVLFFKKVLGKSTFSMLVILVSTVDLVSAHMPFNPVVPNEFYTKGPKLVHDIGEAQHSGRIFVQTNTCGHLQRCGLSPYTLQHIWRHYLWPNTGILYDISYVNGIGGTETQDQWLITELLEKLNLKKRIRFLELTNTQYLVVMKFEEIESEIQAGRLKKIQENIYQVPYALPRAYMVPKGKIAPNQTKAIEEALKDDFDPLRSVILEEGSQVSVMEGAGGKVLDVSYEGPNTVKVTAQSLGGYLVLLDSFYPGWRVLVNGQEREVLRANGLFRSVFLEPGLRQIAFTYQPRSFLWGIYISLTSLCLVAVGLWVCRPKRALPIC